MDEHQIARISEQIARLHDRLDGRLNTQERMLRHHEAMAEERHKTLLEQLARLSAEQSEQDQRLRALDGGLARLQAVHPLIEAGQAGLTLLAASIAAWLGSR